MWGSSEVVPLCGASHGGALVVDGEVAKGEDELGSVCDPGVDERGLRGGVGGAEGGTAGGAPANAGVTEETYGCEARGKEDADDYEADVMSC